LDTGEIALSGIIGPGHVTAIIGPDAWRFLPEEYRIPCAVAGFEPVDILQAVLALVGMVEDQRPQVLNAYGRTAHAQGNSAAKKAMATVFDVIDAEWRGLGTVPASGLGLSDTYEAFDAGRMFQIDVPPAQEPAGCRCGDVLRGLLLPPECGLFGLACTPDHPIGPCMVSAEGACAAHFRYGVRSL
jgi:hydrogenase expression/formation protein HypD